MKTISIFLFLILCSFSENKNPFVEIDPSSDVIELEGTYQNRNLYVQNPMFDNEQNCVRSVVINDQLFLGQSRVTSAAFEIDLSILKLKKGDSLKIQIFHHKGCEPKVLNPEVLYERGTYKE